MPLQRRLPKRGFHNPFRASIAIVNLGQARGGVRERRAWSIAAALVARGLVRAQPDRSRCSGRATLSKALTVKAHAFSESAKAAHRRAPAAAPRWSSGA